MLKELAAEYLKLKKKEQKIRDAIGTIEEQIISEMNPKLEGTTTIETDGMKISVTGKITRTLDYDKFLALNIPAEQSFVEMKPNLNLTLYRAYSLFEPKKAASCVTEKPAKTSIKVEVK